MTHGLSAHQLMLGCQATFIILFELLHVDCPKLPMQVSGGAAIVGSDRLNRQAVGRFDQMVDEDLQADLSVTWNKMIWMYCYV